MYFIISHNLSKLDYNSTDLTLSVSFTTAIHGHCEHYHTHFWLKLIIIITHRLVIIIESNIGKVGTLSVKTKGIGATKSSMKDQCTM